MSSSDREATGREVKHLCWSFFGSLLLALAPAWIFMFDILAVPIRFSTLAGSPEEKLHQMMTKGTPLEALLPFSFIATIGGLVLAVLSIKKIRAWLRTDPVKLLNLAKQLALYQCLMLTFFGSGASLFYFQTVPRSTMAFGYHMAFCAALGFASIVSGMSLMVLSQFTDRKPNAFLSVLSAIAPVLVAGGINFYFERSH
jgi:uncharacterized membrane protein